MEDFAKLLGMIVFFALMVFGLGLLFAFPTMWLINGLFAPAFIAGIFGTAKISVWTAWGVNILTFGLVGKRNCNGK